MALSRLAREFAAEIKNHDWSDAPYRADRAGHHIEDDHPSRRVKEPLSEGDTDTLRMNIMWVVGQVLSHADPNLDPHEFAEACGVNPFTSRGAKSGVITAGFRKVDGKYCQPGTNDVDPE